MKEILILGGTGFVGRGLIRALLPCGLKITATYNNTPPLEDGCRWVRVDLNNPREAERVIRNFDVVIHCAAHTANVELSLDSPNELLARNVVMGNNVIFYASNNRIPHLILLSCGIVYPHTDVALTEDEMRIHKVEPRYFAGAAVKLFYESYSEQLSRNDSTRYTVLRHSNLYGPGDRYDKPGAHVTAAAIRKIYKATSTSIEMWGDGKEKRDILHIDDFAKLVVKIVLAEPSQKYKIYNVSQGEATTIFELYQRLIKISKKTLNVIRNVDAPTIPIDILIDSSAVRTEYNWEPKYTIDTGLEHAYREYANSQA